MLMDSLLLAVSLCKEVLGHYIFKTSCLIPQTRSVLAATGGTPFFSTQKGFVSDHVLSFEVVLAQGSTVNVNADQNAGFWAALESVPTILSSSLVLI